MLNTTDRVQGWSDAVPTPEGEKVVTATGIGLKDVAFQNAYSSDSGRALQTAQLILDQNKAGKDLKSCVTQIYVNLILVAMKGI